MLTPETDDDQLILHIDVPALSLSNAKELKESLLQYGETNAKRIVLDFHKVYLLDSSALGALINFHKELKPRGIELALRKINPSIKELLANVKLDEYMKIYD